MLYLPYLEGALLVAAVAALPVGIRLRRSPRRFLLVRHPDPPKPKPKPNPAPRPEPEPEPEPEVKSAAFEEEFESTGGGTPRIEIPEPMFSAWSNDNFRIDTANQTGPGPVSLVFRQRRPIEIDPAIQPAGPYYMYFPVPEGSAFDQQTRLRTGEFGFQAIPRRAVGLSIAYAVPTYPIPADPAVTGMSTGGFPYYPMSIGQAFTTVNANIGVISVTVINNTSLLVPGPPRVIAVFYLHDLVITTVNKTWGRPNSLWIFHTITGPMVLPSTVNVGH